MKKSLLLFLILTSISYFGYSQSIRDSTVKYFVDSITGQIIYTSVHEIPQFPQGEGALVRFLGQNIHYPASAMNNGIHGRVYVAFIVDSVGNVKNPKIIQGLESGCDEEALRVVNLMPRWIPGKVNGNAVNFQYNLPIVYTLK